MCAQVLPHTPVTPPAAAHTGPAPAHSIVMEWRSKYGSPALGTDKVRNSRRRREKLSNCHTVIECDGSVGDHHGTKPELHIHGDMVCNMGEKVGNEEWGGEGIQTE